MLDIKFIRENPDIVKENIKKKFQDEKLPLVDEVIELDSQRRANIQEADQLRSDRNLQKRETIRKLSIWLRRLNGYKKCLPRYDTYGILKKLFRRKHSG